MSKTTILIKCPDCGKERFMHLGDYNKGKRKTRKCLPCYNKSTIPPNGHADVEHEGYILVYKKGHSRANNRNYVKRAVLVLEESLRRYLKHEEFIHHINGRKDDDRIENLQILTNSEHVKIHAHQRSLVRTLTGKFARASHPKGHRLVVVTDGCCLKS